MNIALIRRKYDPAGGGAEKVAANFVREITARGHQVTVVSEKFRAEETGQLKWMPVAKNMIPASSSAVSFHRGAQRVLKFRREEFDIIYSMCRTYPVDVFRVTEQLHAEWMPINYSKLATLNPRHQGILRLERRALDPLRVKRVVTNSELVKRQVCERFKFPEARVTVVYNGVDTKKFHPAADAKEKNSLREQLGIPAGAFVSLFVAGNFKIKGLNSALAAMGMQGNRIREKSFMAIVGGDDPVPFLKFGQDLGIGDKIKFCGSSRDMRSYYAASDVLLYPSLYEPFANVCLEACACGLPVITTAKNGAAQLIKNGRNGFVVSSAEALRELSAALTEIANLSDTERRDYSAAAISATGPYLWENHAIQLEKIFKKIISEKEDNHG